MTVTLDIKTDSQKEQNVAVYVYAHVAYLILAGEDFSSLDCFEGSTCNIR